MDEYSYNRPLHYGMGKNDDTIYAYTRKEWGAGALPLGTSAHSIGGVIVTMGPPIIIALLSTSLFFVFFGKSSMPGVIISAVFFVASLLWGVTGWVMILKEHRATELCKARGVPKAEVRVTDEHARRWFETHPGQIAITRENFPGSKEPFLDEEGYSKS